MMQTEIKRYNRGYTQSSGYHSKIPVHVVAQPEFLGQHEDKFAFAYTMYITNRSDQNITLRNRHWIITHADGSVEEVIGEGVIGKTPELAPANPIATPVVP